MVFLETPRFPDAVAFGFTGGPRFSTSITAVLSGAEQRNANWSRSRGKWSVDQRVKKQSVTDLLVAHFYVVNGSAIGFRFKDWADYTAVTGSTGVLIPIAGATYQLYKRYTRGSLTYDRIITKPVTGVVFAGAGTYSLDTTTGIMTVVSGVASTGWTGEFDVPVRFTKDELDIEAVDMSDEPVFTWSGIEVEEIRDPP